MPNELKKTIDELLNSDQVSLNAREIRVLKSILKHETISRNVHEKTVGDITFGERIADKVAGFGGSWTFIIIFVVILLMWITLNTFLLMSKAFDPYPYILLNLFLSMIAALQAPVIMMSQNRQNAKDRESAAHDYEVNLKAELEISSLQDKFNDLNEKYLTDLMKVQQEQIRLLELLTAHLIK